MGIEIERKFLVLGDFPKGVEKHIKQGYIDKTLGSLRVFEGCLVISDKNFLHSLDVGLDSKEILDNIMHDEDGELILSDVGTARIRIKDNQGFLTIKGEISSQGTPEFEYPLPLFCAQYFLKKLTKAYIEKIRHCINFEGKLWEVDVFINPPNLIVAEVELSKPDEKIIVPEWVGDEVTGDPAYYNSQIIKRVNVTAMP